MKIEHLDPEALFPNPQNPRVLEQAIAPIADSIYEFGFLVPVVIDENNVILSGHARTRAAISLDIRKIPVVRADELSENQKKAFMLADNRLSENATYDNSLLAEVLRELSEAEYKIEVTGFKQEEINAYLNAAVESLDDILGLDFNDEEVEEETIKEFEEDEPEERKMKKLQFLVTEAQKEIIETRMLEIKETVGRQISNGEILTILCSS